MSKNILIVDDDPVLVRLVDSILIEKGYTTAKASNGLDAMVQIERDDYDLIILDIVMPEINGYDICCELRFNEKYDKIPILILTETEREIDASVGSRVNIDHMQKPVDRNVLLEKVKGLLGSGDRE